MFPCFYVAPWTVKGAALVQPAEIIRPRRGDARMRLVAAFGLALVLSAGGLAAHAETAPPKQKRVIVKEAKPTPASEPSRVDANPSPWTGDLDGMKDRQIIRILVPYSKTLF